MSILFVGGGTLGSLNPLIAVAKEITQTQPTHGIEFWTSSQALDQTVIREAGLRARTIPAGKFRRYFSLRTCVDAVVVFVALFIALGRLLQSRPRVVVSAGSYVAVPVSIAAWCLRIPVIIYQQDVQLGLANRIMSKFARVRTATTTTRADLFGRPTEVVGFALRPDLRQGNRARALSTYELDPSWKTLLVIGGSSGAQHVNELLVGALPFLPNALNIVHITGRGKDVVAIRKHYHAISFTNTELPDLYAVADLVICRAGSNVLAEMLALQKPCIIIPLPGTHQEANARELETAGAIVLQEQTLTPERLAQKVAAVLSSAYVTSMPSALRKVWAVDGAQRLAKIILQYT